MYSIKVCNFNFQTEYLPSSFKGFVTDEDDAKLVFLLSDTPFKKENKAQAVHSDFSVYKNADGWLFETLFGEQMFVTPTYDSAVLFIPDKTDIAADGRVTFLMRLVIECHLFRYGFISLHSACVSIDSKAISFTGTSGMGKSTRAKKWHEELHAEWISGDRPMVDCKNAVAYGVPWDGKEQIFKNVSFPLYTVLDIRRAKTVMLRRLSVSQTRQVLMQQCFIPMWDTDIATTAISNIYALAENINMLRLHCDRDSLSARVTYDKLFINPDTIHKEDTDMKIKDGFTLRKVAGEFMIMPTGSNVAAFDGSVALNEVSAFIYEKLSLPISEEELLLAVLDEYDIDKETAASDLKKVLNSFREYGLLDEHE